MTIQEDIVSRSVKKNDANPNLYGGVFYIDAWNVAGFETQMLAPHPPAYWSWARDRALVQTVGANATWAAAVNMAVTKTAALAWEVTAPDYPRLTAKAHRMLETADEGRGWDEFLQKHLIDFLLTDNGAFIEIERVADHPKAAIRAIHHLSSLRCRRTGNPHRPVIYTDRLGIEHALPWYSVVAMSDQPSSVDTYYGVGYCAASRIWSQLAKQVAIETYLREKVSGSRPQAISFLNGISSRLLKEAIETSEESALQRGAVSWRGAMMVPLIGETEPKISTIDLASLPDGFDVEAERRSFALTVANVLGLDPTELLEPRGGLGTGMQAVMLDEKAKGKGLAAWRQRFTHTMNRLIMPETVTFAFVERDYRDQKEKATVEKMLIDNVGAMIDKGIITNAEGRNLLVDQNVLPRQFLPTDTTTQNSISDDESAASVAAEEAAADAQSDEELTASVVAEVAATKELFAHSPAAAAAPVRFDADIYASAQKRAAQYVEDGNE